ncbi:MAG: TetR/AcrR family transcriptional regulator [Sphingobium sp.]
MARPKQALIIPQTVVEEATRILEKDGLEALSIRMLAARLKVNSASLYHHFASKDEILMAVVRAALRDVVMPPVAEEWEIWVAENAVAYRRLLVAKPYIIPLLLRGIHPHTVAYAIADAKLSEAGVPDHVRPEFLLVLDMTALGSALISVTARDHGIGGDASMAFDHEAMLRNSIKLLIHDMLEHHNPPGRKRKPAARARGRKDDAAPASAPGAAAVSHAPQPHGAHNASPAASSRLRQG